MTFGERVKSLTRQYLLPKVAYNVFGSNVLNLRLIGNGKRGKGMAIEKAIKYTNSNQATSIAGNDSWIPQQTDTTIRLNVQMKAIHQPVTVNGFELIANQDDQLRATDLIKERLEETQDELLEYTGSIGYRDGQGNSGKDPNGMAYIIDDGTNAPDFEGQLRSTYSVLNSQLLDLTSVSGELSLPRLASLYTATSSGQGSTIPTLLVSGEDIRDFYEQLLTPTVRETYSSMGYYNVTKDSTGTVRQGSHQGLAGNHGFVALSYKGIPWVGDEKAQENIPGRLLMLNENFVDWWGWQSNGVLGYESLSFRHTQTESTYTDSPMSEFTGFNWRPWITAQQSFAGISDVMLIGNYGSWQPRRQGAMYNITQV